MYQTTLLKHFSYDASCFKACTEEQQGLTTTLSWLLVMAASLKSSCLKCHMNSASFSPSDVNTLITRRLFGGRRWWRWSKSPPSLLTMHLEVYFIWFALVRLGRLLPTPNTDINPGMFHWENNEHTLLWALANEGCDAEHECSHCCGAALGRCKQRWTRHSCMCSMTLDKNMSAWSRSGRREEMKREVFTSTSANLQERIA